jgi:hypothetical protein
MMKKGFYFALISLGFLTCPVSPCSAELVRSPFASSSATHWRENDSISSEEAKLAQGLAVVNQEQADQGLQIVLAHKELAVTAEQVEQLQNAVALNASVIDLMREDIANNTIAIAGIAAAVDQVQRETNANSAARATISNDVAALASLVEATQSALCPIYDAMRLKPRPTFCPEAPRLVFLSSQKYTGNLGGVSGANAKCQELADAAELDGEFMAWLSDSSGLSPANQFIPSDAPYELADGTPIATDWDDLTDGTIAAPIILDENGSQPEADELLDGWAVWTATEEDGSGIQENPFSPGLCSDAEDDWTIENAEQSGAGTIVGIQASGEQETWTTSVYSVSCDYEAHLYCFEQ